MTSEPPLEPDEVLTADGVVVHRRRPTSARSSGLDPLPSTARLLALAAAPVVVPIAAAGAACLVGLGVAAAGVGMARALLRPSAPVLRGQGDTWSGSVTVLRVEVVVVDVRG